eukprot:m51a1_g11749 hypothetical protein (563) ;mRNA; r:167521-189205
MGGSSSSLARTSRQLCSTRIYAVQVLQRCGLEPPASPRVPSLRRCSAHAEYKAPSYARRNSRESAPRSSRDAMRSHVCQEGGTPRCSRRSTCCAQQAGHIVTAHAHELVSVLFPFVGLRGLMCLRGTCKTLRAAVDDDRDLWDSALRSLVGPQLASLTALQPCAELVQEVLLSCSATRIEDRGRACVEALGIDLMGGLPLDCVADVPALCPQSRLAFFLSRDHSELVTAVSRSRAHRMPFKAFFACVLRRLSPRTAEAGRELARAVHQCYTTANKERSDEFARLRTEFRASGRATPRDAKRCAELALATLLGEDDIPADALPQQQQDTEPEKANKQMMKQDKKTEQQDGDAEHQDNAKAEQQDEQQDEQEENVGDEQQDQEGDENDSDSGGAPSAEPTSMQARNVGWPASSGARELQPWQKTRPCMKKQLNCLVLNPVFAVAGVQKKNMVISIPCGAVRHPAVLTARQRFYVDYILRNTQQQDQVIKGLEAARAKLRKKIIMYKKEQVRVTNELHEQHMLVATLKSQNEGLKEQLELLKSEHANWREYESLKGTSTTPSKHK